MRRPPFGMEPNRMICGLCREIVMNPQWYRGEGLHPGCRIKRQMQDYTAEVLDPRAAQALAILEDLLSDPTPPSLT